MSAVAALGIIPRQIRASRPEFVSFRDRFTAAVRGIPAKALARASGATPKAAERWKAGDNAPSAEALMRLAATFDEVWQAVQAGSCRSEGEAQALLAELRARLEVGR